MTEKDVRCLSEEIVGIRMEELRDATVQLRKVLIGYENEEATFQNYERLKGKNVNGIDLRRTNSRTFKCGCLYTHSDFGGGSVDVR